MANLLGDCYVMSSMVGYCPTITMSSAWLMRSGITMCKCMVGYCHHAPAFGDFG